MSIYKEVLDTLARLGAFETRTEDLKHGLERVERKLDRLLERLTKLETELPALRANLKSEILGDIKAEIVQTNLLLQMSDSVTGGGARKRGLKITDRSAEPDGRADS